MYRVKSFKIVSLFFVSFLLVISFFASVFKQSMTVFASDNIEIIACEGEKQEVQKEIIKWVDFNIDGQSLKSVLEFCKEYRGKPHSPSFAQTLSYLSIKNSNEFDKSSSLGILKKLRAYLDEGNCILDKYGDNKYFLRYQQIYHAIFDGLVGEYEMVCGTTQYGIMGYFPIAKGFDYNHYDDFGNSRSYGYKRRHLGHDFMGQVGTPIIAIEGGTVTELGWNKYGGWRIGIRSCDQKRYYYYAHLRKDRPFALDMKLGDRVEAGQVIGYLGYTGYSEKENTNLKTGSPHLHLGLQLIFDASQEKGSGEIWIDLFGICNFLTSERAVVTRDDNTKEWISQSIKVPILAK